MRKVFPVRRKVSSSVLPLVFLVILPVLVPATALGADAGAVKSFYDATGFLPAGCHYANVGAPLDMDMNK